MIPAAARLVFSLVLTALTASRPIDAVAEDDSYVTHGREGQAEGIASLRAALAG